MEDTELRIGNYINRYFEGELMSKISVVTRDIFDVQRALVEEDFKFKFEPIPLTEEWLLKFGFEKKANNWFEIDYITEIYDKYFSDVMILTVNLDSFRCAGLNTDDDGSPFYTKKSIKYVHQLQNLYFALTGEELQCS